MLFLSKNQASGSYLQLIFALGKYIQPSVKLCFKKHVLRLTGQNKASAKGRHSATSNCLQQ